MRFNYDRSIGLLGCLFACVWLFFAGLMGTAMVLGVIWLWRNI